MSCSLFPFVAPSISDTLSKSFCFVLAFLKLNIPG